MFFTKVKNDAVLMEFVFHRFSPHRAIPHVSIVFFHIKTRIYSSFNTLIIIVINIGAPKSTSIVIKLAEYLMMEYCIPLILMLMFERFCMGVTPTTNK